MQDPDYNWDQDTGDKVQMSGTFVDKIKLGGCQTFSMNMQTATATTQLAGTTRTEVVATNTQYQQLNENEKDENVYAYWKKKDEVKS